jgi:predicted nucleotidyltransferase
MGSSLEAVEVLKREFNATRLFLFGSRANGTATADSDYDFVLVVKDALVSRLDSMTKARSILHDELQISADVFVYPQTEFDEWKNEFNSIPEIASNLGMELPLE